MRTRCGDHVRGRLRDRPRSQDLRPSLLLDVDRLADASDADLLRLSSCDPAAFDAFYGRYERPLLGYFARRTHDPELTTDLAAEVFASALEHAESFDPQREAGTNAGPWLFGIAYHVLLASVRRGRVAAEARRRIGMLDRIELEDDSYERVEALASIDVDVDALVAGLPDKQRVALIARIVDERPYEDIAAELRCSELVARKRVSRALASLRTALSHDPKEASR